MSSRLRDEDLICDDIGEMLNSALEHFDGNSLARLKRIKPGAIVGNVQRNVNVVAYEFYPTLLDIHGIQKTIYWTVHSNDVSFVGALVLFLCVRLASKMYLSQSDEPLGVVLVGLLLSNRSMVLVPLLEFKFIDIT